jgi:hypothetical protein
MLRYVDIVKADHAVASVAAFTGGNNATDTGFLFISLKPLNKRKISVYEVINRLRPKLAVVPGAQAIPQAGQDLRIGARLSAAQFQYTITSDNLKDLEKWAPILLAKMKTLHGLTDVNSDQRNQGLETFLDYDRPQPPGSGSRPRPSTPRSTTRSDSRRSRPCTCRSKSVLCRHGSRAEVLAGSSKFKRHLPDRHQRGPSAAERGDQTGGDHHIHRRESLGPISLR